MKKLKVLIGCEESQAVCLALREREIEAYSCDLRECSGGRPDLHLQMDVFEAIRGGRLTCQDGVSEIFIEAWDAGIFFPDCTYLTCSAEWAYKNPDYTRYPGVGYHQKLKPSTLFGAERRQAREEAIEFFLLLYNSNIERVAIENPVGVMSRVFRKPDQIIQPHYFGDDASKSTCLWVKGFPPLIPTDHFPPRLVNGKTRWGNQTDSGQNSLSPTDDRAKMRSKTYPGIAAQIASQWFE